MQRFDTNRDGKLDQSEFVDALSAAVSTKSDPDAANKIVSESVQLVTRVLKDRHKKDAAASEELTAAAKAAAKELAAAKAELGALAEGKAAARARGEIRGLRREREDRQAHGVGLQGRRALRAGARRRGAAPAAAAPSDAAGVRLLAHALLALGGCSSPPEHGRARRGGPRRDGPAAARGDLARRLRPCILCPPRGGRGRR
ncbi:hypothetical protein JL721_3836 [Aureococcus anophagefferens]|nr:hypothetical protein JL721_3836 [Aureococcus anophagefferens]